MCVVVQDNTKPSDVLSFVERYKAPLVGQYGRETRDKLYKDRRPLVLFFYTVDWTFEHKEGFITRPLIMTTCVHYHHHHKRRDYRGV